MKSNYLIICIFIASILTGACSKGKMHKAKYYNDMGKDNVSSEGYHANEAKRIIDYKDQNQGSIDRQNEKIKDQNNKNLNELNKPNAYKSKKQKRKRYSFYH